MVFFILNHCAIHWHNFVLDSWSLHSSSRVSSPDGPKLVRSAKHSAFAIGRAGDFESSSIFMLKPNLVVAPISRSRCRIQIHLTPYSALIRAPADLSRTQSKLIGKRVVLSWPLEELIRIENCFIVCFGTKGRRARR